MSSKKITTPRKPGCGGRIPSICYHEAEQIEALMSSPDTDAQTRADLSDIIIELSSTARVHVDHPALVRKFYIAAIRNFHEMQADRDQGNKEVRKTLDEMSGVLARIREGQPHDDLMRRYRDEREEMDAITAASKAAQPAKVVDLSLWIQSRPRPICNLLFAETGE